MFTNLKLYVEAHNSAFAEEDRLGILMTKEQLQTYVRNYIEIAESR